MVQGSFVLYGVWVSISLSICLCCKNVEKLLSGCINLNKIFRGCLVGNYWVGTTTAQSPPGRAWTLPEALKLHRRWFYRVVSYHFEKHYKSLNIHGCVGKGVFSLGMHSTYFIVNLLPTTQSCCLKSISILLKHIINSIWLKQIYYNTFSSFQKWTEDNGAIQEHFHYVLCVVEPPLKSPFRQFSVDLRPWNCNFSW